MRGWQAGVCVAALLGVARGAAAEQERGEGARRTGQPDEERARAIELRLKEDQRLRDDTIVAEVTGKRVRLIGTVDDGAERRRAEELVRKMDPTLTIENLLDSEQEQARGDAGITARLQRALAAERALDARAVQVETDKGVVWLRGEVRSAEERKRIIDLARSTDGALVVVDEMQGPGGP